MAEGNGAQSKKSRLISTINSFTNKGSHHHATSTVPASSSSMSSSTSATGGFPSFRFSPDSEELVELPATGGFSCSADDRLAESLPDSPKLAANASGGDTSPLKEYIRKNWASKWDKRSMSLDLDLKGKIITAIEDKRKSVLSHFIPEETSGIMIPSSSNIPEHTGVAVVIGEPTTHNNSSITNSDNSFANEADSSHKFRSSLNQTNKISFDNTSKQVHLSNENREGSVDNLSVASADENYEEVGLDYLENMTAAGQIDSTILDVLFPFSFSPEQLEETPLGNATATNAFESSLETGSDFPESPGGSSTDLDIGSILKEMSMSFALNPWTGVFFLILSGGICISMPNNLAAGFYWFFAGVLFSIAVSQSLFGEPVKKPDLNRRVSNDSVKMGIGTSFSSPFALTEALNQKHPKCQGWMTELEGDYDPFTYHVRQSKIVFVRMEGSFLYISYPHGKHRILKRRFWSDAPLSEIAFSKHSVYNLAGAHIFIAPEKLARKRVWNKKYPIGIKLARFSIQSNISPAPTLDTIASSTPNVATVAGGTPTDIKMSSIHQEQESSSALESSRYRKGDKIVEREDSGEKILYLFARTDREKDDWFRRLVGAAKEERPLQLNKDKFDVSNYVLQKLYISCMGHLIPKQPFQTENIEQSREADGLNEKSVEPQSSKQSSPELDRKSGKPKNVSANAKGGSEDRKDTSSNSSSSSKRETPTENFSEIEKILSIPQAPVFLNALLGRIFFDFLRSTHWTGQVQKLIQKKLNYIRRPQFIDALVVRDLDLGHSLPVIQRASAPFIDSQGLWIDLDITYDGNLCVTLETKLNLMNLRKSPTGESEQAPAGQHGQANSAFPPGAGAAEDEQSSSMERRPPNFLDSDADDSGESSDDDEIDPEDFLAQQDITSSDLQTTSDTNVGKPSKGAKFLRMAEKIANSMFVTEVKVVKKVIANVANIPLILSVELKSCKGTLVVNIPPPPSDRLWIGFRTNPDMQVVAKPKVGERAVNLTHVTEWIRKKLLFEFQRVLVLPNMDDITVPLMEFKLPEH